MNTIFFLLRCMRSIIFWTDKAISKLLECYSIEYSIAWKWIYLYSLFLDQLKSRVFPFVSFRFINESFIGVVSAHIVVFVVQWAAGSSRYWAFNHWNESYSFTCPYKIKASSHILLILYDLMLFTRPMRFRCKNLCAILYWSYEVHVSNIGTDWYKKVLEGVKEYR